MPSLGKISYRTDFTSKVEVVSRDVRSAWSGKITSSGKGSVSTSRTYASPKWDGTRCPEE